MALHRHLPKIFQNLRNALLLPGVYIKDFLQPASSSQDVASFTFASGLWILVTIPITSRLAIQVMQGGKRQYGSVADTSSPTTSDSYIQRQGVSQTFRLGILSWRIYDHIKIIYILCFMIMYFSPRRAWVKVVFPASLRPIRTSFFIFCQVLVMGHKVKPSLFPT